MFSGEFADRATGLLERLSSVVSELADLDLSVASDQELLDLVTGLEQQTRRFATIDAGRRRAHLDPTGTQAADICPARTGLPPASN